MECIICKVPLKRKKINKSSGCRLQKKANIEESEDQNETESESESSDSSTVLSQSEVSGQNYNVDDIKLFLKSTKTKEVYRLKNIYRT